MQHIKRYALWQARCGEAAHEHVVHPLDHRVRGREDEDGAAAVYLLLNRARYQPDRQPRHQLTERLKGGTALVTSKLEVVHRRCRLSVARLGDRVLEVASGRVVHGGAVADRVLPHPSRAMSAQWLHVLGIAAHFGRGRHENHLE